MYTLISQTKQIQKHYNYKNIEEWAQNVERYIYIYSVQPFTMYILLSSSSSNYFI